MLGTIRRHQKWLWFVIVTATIVSFVVFFSPNRGGVGRRGGGSSDVVGSMDGHSITRQEYVDAYNEARLRFRLYSSTWPDEDQSSRMMFNQDQEVRNRLLLVDKLRQLNFQAGDQAVANWITNVFRDSDKGGFRLDMYHQFLSQVLVPKGYSEDDFRRFVQHEVGMGHLISLYGLAGKLVTPQEAEGEYRRENERVKAEVVFIASSNFLSKVQTSPMAIAAFYTNRSANYRLPERAQVNYVRFDATNYFAEVETRLNARTNLNQLIDAEYMRKGTNAYPGLAPAAAKARIRQEFRLELALREARIKANEFTEALFELEPKQPGNLAKLAAAKGLQIKVTPPFSRFQEPPGLEVPGNFSEAAFNLTQVEPFAEQPIVGTESVYVIGFNKKIPSELPPLDSIRARVVEDYRKTQALELARQAGREFRATATNGLAHAKTFKAVAAEAKLSVTDLPPFSEKTPKIDVPIHVSLSVLQNVAFAIAPGHVSDFTSTAEGGFVLYSQSRIPVDDATLKKELPQFLSQIKKRKEIEAFEEWFRRAAQEARITLAGQKEKT